MADRRRTDSRAEALHACAADSQRFAPKWKIATAVTRLVGDEALGANDHFDRIPAQVVSQQQLSGDGFNVNVHPLLTLLATVQSSQPKTRQAPSLPLPHLSAAPVLACANWGLAVAAGGQAPQPTRRRLGLRESKRQQTGRVKIPI